MRSSRMFLSSGKCLVDEVLIATAPASDRKGYPIDTGDSSLLLSTLNCSFSSQRGNKE